MGFSLLAVLGLNASGFRSSLHTAESAAEKAGHKISHALTHAINHSLAQFASIAFVEQAIEKTIEYAEKVNTLSARLGISTDAVQKWDYALKMSNSSIDAAAPFFEKLAIARHKAMAGSGEMITAFQALGVSVDDLKNKRIEDIGLQIAQAFETGDPQQLITSLREVGGKGAGELVQAFRAGFTSLTEEAEKAGVIINEHVVEQLAESADKGKAIWMQFVAQIAPALAMLANFAQAAWRGLNMLARFQVALFTGASLKEAWQDVKDYAEELKTADEAAEERAKRRKETQVGGAEDVANKAEEKAAERRKKLEQEIADLKEKHYVAGLDKEQKYAYLHAQRLKAEKEFNEFVGPRRDEDVLKAQLKIEKLKGEEEEAGRAADKPTRHKASLNHLQQIGGFASAQDPSLQTARKSEQHLHGINGKLSAIHQTLKGSTRF